MKNIKPILFAYKDHCLIETKTILETGKKLVPEIERIKNAWNLRNDETVYAALSLPHNIKMVREVEKVIRDKQALKPTMLIVIGIGGSSLGLKAIHHAINGPFHNQNMPDVKLYIADTIDSDYLFNIYALAQEELENDGVIILNIISKSGTTQEPMLSAQIFFDLMKKTYPKTYQEHIIATTNHGSPLWNFAIDESFTTLTIPPQVGGRYSVFSAVGLFPLALIGIDIDELLKGAYHISESCLDDNTLQNLAAIRAIILAEQYKQNIHIHDMFIFSANLSEIGAWYRQLMGESLGKTDNTGTKKIGITPTTSIGTADLHSVGQLYLGGPYTRYTTFVSVEKNNAHISIFNMTLNKKSTLEDSMLNILDGVRHTYYLDKRPFTLLEIPEKSEYYVGMLMQLHMFEIIYAGFLLNVNPFDQPDVEKYKNSTQYGS